MIEAMKQWLEALELHAKQYPHMQKGYTVDAIASLHQAIADFDKQKPLCTAAMFDEWFLAKSGLDPKTPLYTHPQPKREWVGLTPEEEDALVEQAREVPAEVPCPDYNKRLLTLANAKLKEKNT
jgi:hypothetical protein